MISVCIWGMPQIPEEQLMGLTKDICDCFIPLPGVEKPRICVFFQKDMMAHGLGEEVFIEVRGCNVTLFKLGEFEKIPCLAKDLLPMCEYVECRIEQVPYNRYTVST